MIFRFDDVCINSDMANTNAITDYLFEKFPTCEIIWAVSPLVHEGCGERVYPKIFNAHSDIRYFFKPNRLGLPKIHKRVKVAGHGLIHIDHRLLTKEQQEMSILISCSLIGANIFVPPFNKYDDNTEEICDKNGIRLISFSDGWLSMEHNEYMLYDRWYLHAREWTLDKVKNWFENK